MKRFSMQWRMWSSYIGYSVVGGLLALGLVAIPQAASATNFYAGCPGERNNFGTIQAAIDAAAELRGRHRISICEGMYPENVIIEPARARGYQLIGAGIGRTVITGVAGTSGPIIHVKEMGRVEVEIEELTVDGRSAQGGARAWGIRYEASSGTVDDVEVLNIGQCPAEGLGITAEGSVSTNSLSVHSLASLTTTAASTATVIPVVPFHQVTERQDPSPEALETSGDDAQAAELADGVTRARNFTVIVTRSTVENATRVGILGIGSRMTLHADRNHVVGPAGPGCWQAIGIQVSHGAQARIHRNDVRDNEFPGSGILGYCAKAGTHISNNRVWDSGNGIVVSDSSRVRVSRNRVVSAVLAYYLQILGDLGDPGCPGGVPETARNTIEDNKAIDSADLDLAIISFDLANGVPERNKILSNDFKNSGGDGIHVYDGENNRIRRNKIRNSDSLDAVDETSGGRTAGTANRWNKNNCDTSFPARLCR